MRLSDVGGLNGSIVVKCFDWDGTGEHDLIGQTTLSMREASFGEMQVCLI